MSRSTRIARPAPAWLVEPPYEEQTLGVLKSGKEAEVFVVERRSADRSCLLAHKRFRPRHPTYKGELRDLGFTHGAIFRHDSVYREGWHLNSRDRRAVQAGTSYGQQVRAKIWPINEFEMLERAWEAGVSVPYPVARTDDGILMEFIGEGPSAAPRLATAGLDRSEAVSARDQLLDALARLCRARVVHADLSVYNVLWAAGRITLIDFPQAVDAATNADAPDLLRRDLENVVAWFERRGAPIDLEPVYTELVTALLW